MLRSWASWLVDSSAMLRGVVVGVVGHNAA
jgi:hypothetical protein